MAVENPCCKAYGSILLTDAIPYQYIKRFLPGGRDQYWPSCSLWIGLSMCGIGHPQGVAKMQILANP